jgi:adenylyl cyclase-associated protein
MTVFRLVVKPAPRDFIESAVGGSDYWANNIRKEYRNVNADQIAFCDTFKALLVGLMAYVKEFHTTGLAWNAKGIDVGEFSADSSVKVESGVNTPTPVAVTAAAPKADLFASLNKDSAVTSGLKKVTKDMQTWRSEYKVGDGPAPSVVAKASTTKVIAVAALKGPSKLEFQAASSKWLVEYQTASNGTINIAINDKKETVYIFGCVGATVDIKGKCKSIVVDGCKQVKVHFDSAMASCEVVNCQRMQIHCREVVPAVAVDKTDGIVIFLPITSLHTEVVASKSSEMNISWPDENGDLIERPIPEQYVHRIKGTSITADVSDLYSH